MHITLALARGEGVVLLNLSKLSHIFIPQLRAHTVGFTLTLLGGMHSFFPPLLLLPNKGNEFSVLVRAAANEIRGLHVVPRQQVNCGLQKLCELTDEHSGERT